MTFGIDLCDRCAVEPVHPTRPAATGIQIDGRGSGRAKAWPFFMSSTARLAVSLLRKLAFAFFVYLL